MLLFLVLIISLSFCFFSHFYQMLFWASFLKGKYGVLETVMYHIMLRVFEMKTFWSKLLPRVDGLDWGIDESLKLKENCSLPGSSLHGIFQAKILQWVAIAAFRGSSWPRDWICTSCIGRQILYHWATRESPIFWYIGWVRVPEISPYSQSGL